MIIKLKVKLEEMLEKITFKEIQIKCNSIRLTVIMFVLMSSLVNAQDKSVQEAIISICKRYVESKEELSCKVVYSYYNNKYSKVLADKQSGELSLWNGCFIFKFSGTEMIKNEKYYVAINNQEKTVFTGYSPDKSGTPIGFDLLDSLQKAGYANARYISNNGGGQKTIRYILSQNSSDSMDVNYDPKSFIVKSCKLYLNKATKFDDNDNSPVILIEYQNTQIKTVDNAIKEKYYATKYVAINNKKVTLKNPCKGYQLVNNFEN